MTTDLIPKTDLGFLEAPASWNTSYVTPEGFVCRITLRGETGRDLLEKAGNAIAFLTNHGYQPELKALRSSGEIKQCPIHQCDMRRFEKNGKAWFSHKLEDGSWCNGKQK